MTVPPTKERSIELDREWVQLAIDLIAHEGHNGIPGAPDDSCMRCNIERALTRLVAERDALQEALEAAKDVRALYTRSDMNWIDFDAAMAALEHPE